MSFKALGWVVDQKPRHPADKLLLYGLADRHNTEDGTAYPSVAWLQEFSGLDRKTVIAGLGRLEAAGYIADSGKRRGRTKQIKEYELCFDRTPGDVGERPDTQGDSKGSQKRNGSVFPRKGSQKRDTEPVIEPVSQKTSSSSIARAKRGCLVPEYFWPSPGKGTETERIVSGWPESRLRQEVERFIAFHRQRGTLGKDWQRGFTTWALNAERFEARGRNGNGTDSARGDGFDHIANPMVRVGLRREAERRLAGNGTRGPGGASADPESTGSPRGPGDDLPF